MYFLFKFQPEIAGIAKRWGGAPTCEQDYDVQPKPWCFISRCGSTAISCWRSLYSNGTFALLATFISLVTNVGLDTFRQIVALNSRSWRLGVPFLNAAPLSVSISYRTGDDGWSTTSVWLINYCEKSCKSLPLYARSSFIRHTFCIVHVNFLYPMPVLYQFGKWFWPFGLNKNSYDQVIVSPRSYWKRRRLCFWFYSRCWDCSSHNTELRRFLPFSCVVWIVHIAPEIWIVSQQINNILFTPSESFSMRLESLEDFASFHSL